MILQEIVPHFRKYDISNLDIVSGSEKYAGSFQEIVPQVKEYSNSYLEIVTPLGKYAGSCLEF
jgi:hypothetical protein